MRKYLLIIVVALMLVPVTEASSQSITSVIQAGVKKVIRALDLRIQRLQNKTIWLQNAQKAIENTLSKLRLDEISDWVERQRTLYRDYFDELAKVKMVIAYYHRIKGITDKQIKLVREYQRAWGTVRQDDHFSPEEIAYMGKVYTGILDQSANNLDLLFIVIGSFATTMTDAKRIELINTAGDKIDENYNDLSSFNRQNVMLSVQRSKDLQEVAVVKALYGIE